MRDDSKDPKSCKDVLLGLQKLKITFKPCLGPQMSIFGKKRNRKIFDGKSLTMGTLENKLPLIVIIAP